MAGATISLPFDEAPMKRVKDELKEVTSNIKAYQRELKKTGSDTKKLTADIDALLSRQNALRSTQSAIQSQGRAAVQFNKLNPTDFMGYKRGVAPTGPNLPWSNDEHQMARSKVSQLGSIDSATMTRAGLMRDAQNSGNAFGYLKQNALEWMHRRGGMMKDVGSAYESGALRAGAGSIAGGMAITNAVIQSVGFYSEDARIRESDARSATGMDVNQRRLYESELSQKRNQDKYGGIDALPVVGGYLSAPGKYIEGRLRGNDAMSRAEGATRDSLARAGMNVSDAQEAMKIWSKRYYADKYGSELLGSIMNTQNELLKKIGLGSNDAAEGQMSMLDKSIARKKLLEDQGYQLVGENNFSVAETKFQEASREISNPKWKNPMDVWMQEDASRHASVMYAKSQNPTPALRIGQ